MNVDWHAFNQNMQNMAASMQQFQSNASMTSVPHFNPNPMHQTQYNIQHMHHQPHPHIPLPNPFAAPQQPQQVQQGFLVPSIPIAIGQQPQPMQQMQPQQPPFDLNDFAQQMTTYSQQMVQSLNNVLNPQNTMNTMNNSIVIQPQTHQNTVQQIFHIHSNNGQQQIHQIQHITAPPLLIINNQTFTNHTDVIDLTNDDNNDQDTEEYKEVFVPWNDEDIPNEYKCPISLEIMCEPVILSDGFYYEREYIEDWLRSHNRSPMTNLPLANPTLTADYAFRNKIDKWKQTQWEVYNARNHMEEELEDEYSQSASQYSEYDEAESQHMQLYMEHDHDHDVKMKM
eukprot:168298_1